MKPTNEWMKIWKEKRDILSGPNDLNEYFELDEIAGQKLDWLSFGKVSVPSGEILVRDPLVYLNKDEEPYFEKVPTGEFEAVGAVVVSEEDCARYAAVRVKFNDNNPHKIVIAKWIEYGIRNGFLPPTFTLNDVTPFSVV